MSNHSSLNVSRLVAMMFAAPYKHAEAVELVGFQALGDRGPQPILLGDVAILYITEREKRSDPVTFGVMCHVVRNGHDQHACQHPTCFAIFSANQTPIVHWNWRRWLRLGFRLLGFQRFFFRYG